MRVLAAGPSKMGGTYWTYEMGVASLLKLREDGVWLALFSNIDAHVWSAVDYSFRFT